MALFADLSASVSQLFRRRDLVGNSFLPGILFHHSFMRELSGAVGRTHAVNTSVSPTNELNWRTAPSTLNELSGGGIHMTHLPMMSVYGKLTRNLDAGGFPWSKLFDGDH